MSFEKIKNYIESNLEKGIEEEKIRKKLLEVGWAEDQVEEAFEEVKRRKNKKPAKKLELSIYDKKKISGIVLAVLILIGAVGGGYFLFTSESEPSEEQREEVKKEEEKEVAEEKEEEEPKEEIPDPEISPREKLTDRTEKSLSGEGRYVTVVDFTGSYTENEQSVEMESTVEFKNNLPESGLIEVDGRIGFGEIMVSSMGEVKYIDNNLFIYIDHIPALFPFPEGVVEEDILLAEDLQPRPENFEEFSEEFFRELKEETGRMEGIDTDVIHFMEAISNFYGGLRGKFLQEELVSIDDFYEEGGVERFELSINSEIISEIYREVFTEHNGELEDFGFHDAVEGRVQAGEEPEEIKEIVERIDYDLVAIADGERLTAINFEFDYHEEPEEAEGEFSISFRELDEDFEVEFPWEFSTVEEALEGAGRDNGEIKAGCDLKFDARNDWISVSDREVGVSLKGYDELEHVEYWLEDDSLAQISDENLPTLKVVGAPEVENETTYLIAEDPSQGRNCRTRLEVRVFYRR